LSLPRLELMGALFAARLIGYIQSAASKWKPFELNRVEEIQQLVEPTRWRHCPGKRNPADVLSRGASLTGLSKNCCWWQGPRWLAEPSDAWTRKLGPSESKPPSPPDEGRSPQAALLVSVVTHSPDHGLDPRRYGDNEKLFWITALCLRFVHNCGSAAEDHRSGPLTATKLEASEQFWVRIAQRQAFPKEIEALKRKGKVPDRSELDQLTPYLDAAGTLRVVGRLEKSNLPFSAKHPTLLPSDHEVPRGLVRCCHLRQLHSGVSQTLFALRQRYWIPRGRSRVRQVLRGCLQCRWATGRPPRLSLADLPEARTTPAPAFAHVGMDFAGPLFVRGTRKTTIPRYVCLITCMVSRAVHLELVPEMSTVGVLQALRRFIARRGRPAIKCSGTSPEKEFDGNSSPTGTVDGRLLGTPHSNYERVAAEGVGAGAIGRGRALNHPVRSRGLSQRPAADPRGRETRGTCPLQPVPTIIGSGIHVLSRSGRLRKELTPKRGEVQAMGEKVAVPPAADRQRVASLVKRRWTGNTEGPKLNDLVLILEDKVPQGRCPLGVVVELFPLVARSTRLRPTKAEMTRPVAELVVLEPAHISDGRTSSPSGGEDVPCETSPTPNMPPNSHQIVIFIFH
ncbi:hypothetical protein T03_16795, partial [Trichinella britovi]